MKIKKLAEIEKTVTEEEIQKNIRERAIRDISENKFLNQLVGGFKKIEEEDKRVSDVVMNAKTYSDFRGIHLLTLNNDIKDLSEGAVAMLWGAVLWVREDVPEWEVRVYAEGDTALVTDFPSIAKAKVNLGLYPCRAAGPQGPDGSFITIKPDGTIIVPKDNVTISIEKNKK